MPLYRHLTHSHTGKETVVLNCTILHLWPPHLPTLGPWLLMDVADRRPVFTPTFFHNINANRSVSSWCITPWSRPVFAIPFSTAASKLRCNVKKKTAQIRVFPPICVLSFPLLSFPYQLLFQPTPTFRSWPFPSHLYVIGIQMIGMHVDSHRHFLGPEVLAPCVKHVSRSFGLSVFCCGPMSLPRPNEGTDVM